ncbi:helix-turn-helix domain-containing protein [Streptosporangium saharense]|uniref:helix-turn-helix domain-containing protein n=1 Tax=Streptosporangium saharense TaxID=1706840 RepID=UPI00367EA364
MTRINPARIQTVQELTEQLAELFRQGGWSAHRLSAASGLSTATIHAMINGTTTLSRADTLKAFVEACGRPPGPWLQARARVAPTARRQPSPDREIQSQLDALRARAELAEAALAATGKTPDQLIQSATINHLRDLTTRDPTPADRKNGHLYLVAYPIAGRQDALAQLFNANPVRQLDATVQHVTQTRGGPSFSPDLSSGRWEPYAEGYVAVSGLHDINRVREDSLLMLFVHDDGGVGLLCGRGVTHASAQWRPLGSRDEPATHRVVIPSLVLGLTHGALALAGTLADRYANYRGQWHIGLRLDGLRQALAYDHIRHGDEDTIHPYGKDLYERTTPCTTDQLLAQPAAIAERLIGPLLRGLTIDKRYLPYGPGDQPRVF